MLTSKKNLICYNLDKEGEATRMEDLFSLLIFIFVLIYVVVANREVVEKLTWQQRIGVAATFIMTIGVAVGCFYIGSQMLQNYIENGFIQMVIKIIMVIVVMTAAIKWMHLAFRKITNGLIGNDV